MRESATWGKGEGASSVTRFASTSSLFACQRTCEAVSDFELTSGAARPGSPAQTRTQIPRLRRRPRRPPVILCCRWRWCPWGAGWAARRGTRRNSPESRPPFDHKCVYLKNPNPGDEERHTGLSDVINSNSYNNYSHSHSESWSIVTKSHTRNERSKNGA